MKISKQVMINAAVIGGLILVGSFAPALAADTPDWAKNTGEGIDTFTAVVTTIVGGLIGLAIVAYGGSVCFSGGRIDWGRLGNFLIAGFLVGGGPALVVWWIALNKTGN